ncbi:MAG TPA: hypothetical protein VHM19_00790, partial [Polyangiales bacterium]|nr:hypothetical protein [Polyangiales bacterium]
MSLVLGVLSGCPQLLDDTFKVNRERPDAGPKDPPKPVRRGPDAGSTPPAPAPKNRGAELRELLAHRYDFDGLGNAVLDSIGTANGTSTGVSLDGSGKLALSSADQYVDLPSGLISGFESVSIECWVNWAGSSASYARDGTGAWQNLFTFGTSDQGEGRQGSGTRYIYLTPQPAS